uniref:SHSP domain-containing protein n=1 Tax=Periophthalmus magnuspinnatus TaxID=409849 RepID=A0A3B3ZZC8_9GOBI
MQLGYPVRSSAPRGPSPDVERKWWESSRSFNPDTGLLPLLDLERSLWSQYWPWYCPAPLIVPHISGSMHQPAPSAGPEQYTWRVSLDVSHFSPSEISLSVKDGFLQIGGRHEERPDEHGFVARCFTRKYRLPAEIDVAKIVSWLSADGILTVEAPVRSWSRSLMKHNSDRPRRGCGSKCSFSSFVFPTET